MAWLPSRRRKHGRGDAVAQILIIVELTDNNRLIIQCLEDLISLHLSLSEGDSNLVSFGITTELIMPFLQPGTGSRRT